MTEVKKTTEAIINVDYYLRVCTLQNILIKKGLISKEEFEEEYIKTATEIATKLKKDKQNKQE